MAEAAHTEVWTVDSVVERIKSFSNPNYVWSKLHEEKSGLDTIRKAAVLVPLFVKDGDIHVWLTLRSKELRKDPGDVAFPGGKRDGNEDEIETCVREAHEEIGLPPTDVEIVGPIPPRISRHNILVSPIIGLVKPEFKPAVNTTEVEVAFSLPLRRFLSKERHRSGQRSYTGAVYNMPYFEDEIDGKVITTYGLTASTCVEVAMAIFQKNPEFGPLLEMSDGLKQDVKNPFECQIKLLDYVEKELKANL